MLSEEHRELLRDVGSLFLRLGMAIPLLALHGWPKWMKYAERAPGFEDPIGVGSEMALNLTIFAEVGCAVLLILGLATRFAGIIIAGMFAIIVFIVHAGDSWEAVEKAWMYGVWASAVAMIGPGRISVDAVIEFASGD